MSLLLLFNGSAAATATEVITATATSTVDAVTAPAGHDGLPWPLAAGTVIGQQVIEHGPDWIEALQKLWCGCGGGGR
jgi:hypothetical protein